MNEMILIVDDEPKIVKQARDYLESGGFRVVTAGDGKTALAVARHERPDLIVLDLNLPQMDGLDVCRALRRESDVPIIMLTARVDEADRLIGLELGADDYVTKPFSPRELVARVRAVLRRAEPEELEGEMTIGDVVVQPAGRTVSVAGAPVELTGMEFDLLAFLAAHPGIVMSRERLLERVWGLEFPGGTRTVDVHVAQLRKKLDRPDLIRTVRGSGYKAVA